MIMFVAIVFCSFFSEAVFDIHNCLEVTVENCTFSDNYGSGIITEPFRGNTGGLSITYNRMDAFTSNPSITVSSCNFINNTAVPSESFNTDQVFSNGVFTGRGGGMAVFVNENRFNISAEVSNCYYYQNKVSSYGGGCYILFRGTGSHTAWIKGNVYDSNMAMLGGAGIILVGVGETRHRHHLYIVRSCIFERNMANIGVGLYYLINLNGGTSNILIIEDTVFDGNTFLADNSESFGAAIAVDIEDNFEQKESPVSNMITNWYVLYNQN